MIRCPKCGRFGVEPIGRGFYECLWRECLAKYNGRPKEKPFTEKDFKPFFELIKNS